MCELDNVANTEYSKIIALEFISQVLFYCLNNKLYNFLHKSIDRRFRMCYIRLVKVISYRNMRRISRAN